MKRTFSVWVTRKEERICKNCKHFYQHYIRQNEREYIPCFAGHCVRGRIKDKEAEDTCKYFEIIGGKNGKQEMDR